MTVNHCFIKLFLLPSFLIFSFPNDIFRFSTTYSFFIFLPSLLSSAYFYCTPSFILSICTFVLLLSTLCCFSYSLFISLSSPSILLFLHLFPFNSSLCFPSLFFSLYVFSSPSLSYPLSPFASPGRAVKKFPTRRYSTLNLLIFSDAVISPLS